MSPLYVITFFFLVVIGIYVYFFWDTLNESPIQWVAIGGVLVIGLVFIETIRRSQKIEVPESIKAITKEDGSRPYQTFEQVVHIFNKAYSTPKIDSARTYIERRGVKAFWEEFVSSLERTEGMAKIKIQKEREAILRERGEMAQGRRMDYIDKII